MFVISEQRSKISGQRGNGKRALYGESIAKAGPLTKGFFLFQKKKKALFPETVQTNT